MRKLVHIALLIALMGASGFLVPLSAQGDASRKTLRKAKEYMEYEEYTAALPHVQELLNQDPGNAYYNYWMGKCLFKAYRKNQAIPYLQKVEQINPDVAPDFHWIYGLCLHYNLSFEKAIQEYTKELDRHLPGTPEHGEVSNRISQCMYALNAVPVKGANKVVVKNMGPGVNSEFSEHSPVVTRDAEVVAFTARRPNSMGAQPEAGYYDEDVYLSQREGKSWGVAENAGQPVNSKGHDATISISPEGKLMYIYRHLGKGGIYMSRFDDAEGKWTKPESAGKPFNSRGYEASICVNPDSTLMFFTSDRPGGFGGLDIYRVRRNGKNWGTPENLGPVINTPFNEDSPYLHTDNKTLYFSSNGPNTQGGYDVFVTEWDSAANLWLSPVNLGPPINSPDDEIYFVLTEDGKHGFYTSGKAGGYGEKDLYEFDLPSFPYPKRFNTMEVAGIVQDVHTLDTLVAWVRLIDKETGLLLDSIRTGPQTGRYSFNLEPERAYSLEVTTEGYDDILSVLEAPPPVEEDITLERNFYVGKEGPPPVPPPPVAEALPEFQHLYFDFDKAEVRPTEREELRRLADFLKQRPGFNVQVLGHTDWYGTGTYNQALSERRIAAAAAALRELGVDPARIQTAGYSENRPLEGNSDDTGRQYNRRCEFQLIDTQGQVAAASTKVRNGGTPPEVDHTRPRGAPGFDQPDAVISGSAADGPMRPALPVPATPAQPGSIADPSITIDGPASDGSLGLRHIYFDHDQHGIKPQYRSQLEQVLAMMRQDPSLELIVKGHTDSDGSNAYNEALSDRRCKSVQDFFALSGISGSRLTMNGHSEDEPAAPNDTEDGKARNRRVEFELRKGGQTILRSNP